MKALIVICALVLLIQLGTLGVSVVRGDGKPQPDRSEIESGREPKAADYPIATRFNALLDPFRPRIELPWESKMFPGGVAETVEYTKGAKDKRIAKFELTAGGGVAIAYSCGVLAPTDCREQEICLCAAGTPVLDFPCPHVAGNGVCDADGNVDAITVYGETGMLEFSGLTPAGGTVRQR